MIGASLANHTLAGNKRYRCSGANGRRSTTCDRRGVLVTEFKASAGGLKPTDDARVPGVPKFAQARLPHHHQRADRDAVIKVDDVFIGHTEAA